MKIKENYKVREIAGENLIVEQGKSQSDMTKVISLNNTALLLWKELQGREFSLEDAAEILMNHRIVLSCYICRRNINSLL